MLIFRFCDRVGFSQAKKGCSLQCRLLCTLHVPLSFSFFCFVEPGSSRLLSYRLPWATTHKRFVHFSCAPAASSSSQWWGDWVWVLRGGLWIHVAQSVHNFCERFVLSFIIMRLLWQAYTRAAVEHLLERNFELPSDRRQCLFKG